MNLLKLCPSWCFGSIVTKLSLTRTDLSESAGSNMAVRLTKGLSHDELEVILKPVIASYQGVFNHDCLQPIIDHVSKSEDQPKELTLIIQTDDIDSKGEHYQVVYMDLRPDCRHVEFFYPYGLIPIQEGTRSLMEAVKA